MNIFIRSIDGKKDPFDVQQDIPIVALKQMFADSRGFDPELVRLIYKGQILEDAQTITDYGVQPEDCLIAMIVKKKPEVMNQQVVEDVQQNHDDDMPPLGDGGEEHIDENDDFDINQLLQMIANGNAPPQFQELVQQLVENPDFVEEMMNQQGGLDGVQLNQEGMIQLTDEEDASITMLCESGGFARDDVLAMFIAMGRDINQTADAMFQNP